MKIGPVRVLEVSAGDVAGRAARLACDPGLIPTPGRYLMAWERDAAGAALATPLFLRETFEDGFLAAPPVPRSWEPGLNLEAYGPQGRGFTLPGSVRRLALAVMGNTAERLRPLLRETLQAGGAVALFADLVPPGLPVAVEINPLSALPEAPGWADYLAVDLPVGRVRELRGLLGLKENQFQVTCPAQALVTVPFPCGGTAECGACAVPYRRSWKLACQDGPVFSLRDLLG